MKRGDAVEHEGDQPASSSSASASSASRASASGIAGRDERLRFRRHTARIEGDRELLGRSRVLLAPEREKSLGVDGPADRAQPVDTGMAAAAEADQQRQARDAGAAMVNDERGGGKAGLRADPAEAAIPADDRSPMAAIAAPVMLLARIAGGAEAASGQPGRPAPAPQDDLPCCSLPCPAGLHWFAHGCPDAFPQPALDFDILCRTSW